MKEFGEWAWKIWIPVKQSFFIAQSYLPGDAAPKFAEILQTQNNLEPMFHFEAG